MPDHDSQYCAATGHFIGSVHVIYCPHHQQWTVVHSAGTDVSDTLYDSGTSRLGPFDTAEDAFAQARAHLAAHVHVRARQFLAEIDRGRREPADPDEPF